MNASDFKPGDRVRMLVAGRDADRRGTVQQPIYPYHLKHTVPICLDPPMGARWFDRWKGLRDCDPTELEPIND